MEKTTIRRFEDRDAEALAQLFFTSVHSGTRAHYTKAQRRAWAPEVPPLAKWHARLSQQIVFVAECGAQLAGFMSVRADGYIDLAFVAPEKIGSGVGKQLYDAVEAEARQLGAQKLWAEASHSACRFFERQGWTVLNEQSVTRNGVALTNFQMEKHLG